MLVLLDTNIFLSALLTFDGPPGRIYREWRSNRFDLVTSTEQLDELRKVSRNPKFRGILQQHDFGTLVNLMHRAIVYGSIPRKHQAADPADSYLLDLIEAAQPDYAITGDKRSGLLQLGTLGRTRILTAVAFVSEVLHL
jgi:putative PIN family toxin of toxin-antitoxin system